MARSVQYTLGSVVALTGGVLQTGPFGSQLHASDYRSTGTPLVMPVNLGDNEVHEKGISRVGPSDARKLRRHAFREGDIVFSRRGDVGRRSLIREAEAGWLCGTGCLAARFGNDMSAVNPAYVAEYLGSKSAQSWLVDNAVGGTMLNLNTSILAALPISLPPKPEQDRIVATLNEARETANVIEQLIVKKDSIRRGIMQHLLTGRTRLPGFDKPWKTRRLSDLLDFSQPGRYLVSSAHYGNVGTPVLTAGKTFVLGHTTEKDGIYSNIPAIIFDDFTTASKFVDFPFKAKSSAMKILTARPGVSARYLFERMQLINFSAVGHKRRWIAEYSKLEVAVPDTAEQVAIASALEEAGSEIAQLKARLVKNRSLKTGMAQQLLTGRARLAPPAAS